MPKHLAAANVSALLLRVGLRRNVVAERLAHFAHESGKIVGHIELLQEEAAELREEKDNALEAAKEACEELAPAKKMVAHLQAN